MSRIRTIKPDFWTDGTMIGLSIPARLFFIGTWNFTLCDAGHLPDDPLGLKLRILPADPVDPVALLDELLSTGRIVRLDLPDGRRFLHIVRFTDHQKIDTRWASRCPVCTHLAAQLTEPRVSSVELTETRAGREGKGMESKGGEGFPPSPNCPKHPGGTDAPCRACGDARRSFEAWREADKRKATPTPGKRPRPGDGHRHDWDAHDYCTRCEEPRHAIERVEGVAA